MLPPRRPSVISSNGSCVDVSNLCLQEVEKSSCHEKPKEDFSFMTRRATWPVANNLYPDVPSKLLKEVDEIIWEVDTGSSENMQREPEGKRSNIQSGDPGTSSSPPTLMGANNCMSRRSLLRTGGDLESSRRNLVQSCRSLMTLKEEKRLVNLGVRTKISLGDGQLAYLRGASETWEAIQAGKVLRFDCWTCETTIQCIEDAEMVLCPECRIIAPLENRIPGLGGVGLGVKVNDQQFESQVASSVAARMEQRELMPTGAVMQQESIWEPGDDDQWNMDSGGHQGPRRAFVR